MKTIVLISLLSFLSMGVFAQIDLSLKLDPPIDFNSDRLAMNSTYFSFKVAKTQIDYKNYLEQPKKAQPDLTAMNYCRKMPIAKPRGNNWNMPIAVPDSSIVYSIKVIGPTHGGLLKYNKK